MSLTRLRECLTKRLSLKSAAFSTLALSTLAGSVMLSGGAANALTCPFGGSGLIAPTCTTGVWYDTTPVTDKQINFVQGPTANSGGTIEWKWIDVNMNGTWLIPPDPHSVDEWHVDVDFNPDLMTPPNGPQSILRYFIRVTNPNQHFEDVSLGSIIGPGTGTVTKEIYSVVNQMPGTLLGTLTNSGTLNLWPSLFPVRYSELFIVDTATPGTSTIDAYQNVFRQTPGPLPILGAGAAFGFSRKLRSRIKASAAA